jgi:hypothetical protein
MGSEYDFAKPGLALVGHTVDLVLGHQAIRPLALDALAERLKPFPLNWEYMPFAKVNRNLVPDRPGVYLFVVHPQAANIKYHSIVLYFGRARDLRARFGDYIAERYGMKEDDRKYVTNMLTVYRNRIQFGFAELNYYHTEFVEDLLIDAFRPCANRQVPKPLPAF